MKILLVTPPLTQLNTPYPATCQLLGFLRSKSIEASQMDLSIELIQHLFTRINLEKVFAQASLLPKHSKWQKNVLQQSSFYCDNIEAVVRFLSGKDRTLQQKFANKDYWPSSNRIPSNDDLEWAFGVTGISDKAMHLCSLFLKDVSEFIKQTIDPNFELIRYAEHLCERLADFNVIETALNLPLCFTEELMLQLLEKKIASDNPEYIAFTIPFPGNLFAALRCAKWVKDNHSKIKVCMGGGYVNTELRSMSDHSIFKYVDFITYDDGELPLWRILSGGEYVRTLFKTEQGEIKGENLKSTENIKFADNGTPNYDGLTENSYINLLEFTNPMHALWSNGKWNKMQLAHGCYWAKCTFCDVNLDYIKRFEPVNASLIVDKMEQIIAQTGESGFHFVDEAAPPALLRKVSEEIIKRKLVLSFWTNIRFEQAFTSELCYLLSKAGCIAVSGGLEVASPRILKLINKGITIETATATMQNFSNMGIMTHAYLMYGYPSQTEQETLSSLEVVRNLFENGYLQSAFWHRYAMTIHSPSGKNPTAFGAKHIDKTQNNFANNEIPFESDFTYDLEKMGNGLRIATYNYMQGMGYDLPVKRWFKR